MSGFLTRALVGCAAVAIIAGGAAYLAQRINTKTVVWDLSPDQALSDQEVQEARRVLDLRLKSLTREFAVSKWEIAPSGGGLKLSLSGRRDFEKAVPFLCGKGLLELRLVEDTFTEGAAVPDGCELLMLREEMVNLEDTLTPIVRETPLAVKKEPELTCSRFTKVHYATHGFRMKIVVTIDFLEPDGKRFAEVTGDNIGRRLAVVMDGVIQVAARIEQKVEGGRVQLLGIKGRVQARRLADFLRYGVLPCSFQATPVDRPNGAAGDE